MKVLKKSLKIPFFDEVFQKKWSIIRRKIMYLDFKSGERGSSRERSSRDFFGDDPINIATSGRLLEKEHEAS